MNRREILAKKRKMLAGTWSAILIICLALWTCVICASYWVITNL